MLIVMVGLPGAGKSTWAGENFRHIVSPDEIRRTEFRTTFDERVERAVWRQALARTAVHLERDQAVCFDATSVSRHRRRRLLAIAFRIGAPAVAVWVRTPIREAWRRNRRRPRPVPRRSFFQLARALEAPSVEEGFVAVLEL